MLTYVFLSFLFLGLFSTVLWTRMDSSQIWKLTSFHYLQPNQRKHHQSWKRKVRHLLKLLIILYLCRCVFSYLNCQLTSKGMCRKIYGDGMRVLLTLLETKLALSLVFFSCTNNGKERPLIDWNFFICKILYNMK